MSERTMLLEHGTRALALRPSSLLAAAEEDLRRFHRSADEAAGERENFAFHRRHVRKAATKKAPGINAARLIIQYALDEIGLGQASGKHWTRVIYSEPELLAAALR